MKDEQFGVLVKELSIPGGVATRIALHSLPVHRLKLAREFIEKVRQADLDRQLAALGKGKHE
jgi:hypothetical protein